VTHINREIGGMSGDVGSGGVVRHERIVRNGVERDFEEISFSDDNS